MPLIKGHRYSWSRIIEETGADGSAPSFLLHAGDRIVAACLTLDLNPDAPKIVLVGNSHDVVRYADLFCAQPLQIPVCVKGDGWVCHGQFKLARASSDPAELREHAVKAKREDLYKILFLEEVS